MMRLAMLSPSRRAGSSARYRWHILRAFPLLLIISSESIDRLFIDERLSYVRDLNLESKETIHQAADNIDPDMRSGLTLEEEPSFRSPLSCET